MDFLHRAYLKSELSLSSSLSECTSTLVNWLSLLNKGIAPDASFFNRDSDLKLLGTFFRATSFFSSMEITYLSILQSYDPSSINVSSVVAAFLSSSHEVSSCDTEGWFPGQL